MKKYLLVIILALMASVGTARTAAATSSSEATLTITDLPHTLPVGSYEMAVTVNSEHMAKALITAKKPLRQFSIVAIEYMENPDPNATTLCFKKTGTLYTLPVLYPEKPLVAFLQLIGSLPNIGIVYETENGTKHTLTVGISGKDGSWFTSPVHMVEK